MLWSLSFEQITEKVHKTFIMEKGGRGDIAVMVLIVLAVFGTCVRLRDVF